jgi:hypothetical protein
MVPIENLGLPILSSAAENARMCVSSLVIRNCNAYLVPGSSVKLLKRSDTIFACFSGDVAVKVYCKICRPRSSDNRGPRISFRVDSDTSLPPARPGGCWKHGAAVASLSFRRDSRGCGSGEIKPTAKGDGGCLTKLIGGPWSMLRDCR